MNFFWVIFFQKIFKAQIDFSELLHVNNIYTLKSNFEYKGFSVSKIDNKIYLIGGQNKNQEFSNEFFEFDTQNESLQKIKIQGDEFKPRRAHSSVVFGNFIVIFGGVGEDQYYNELFHFYPQKKLLKKIQIQNIVLPALANVKGVLAEDQKIYFFGGFSLKGLSNQILIYDVLNKKFENPIVFGTLPSPREFFSMVYLKGQIFIFGGYSNSSDQNDFYSFDISQNRWMKIELKNQEKPQKSQKMQLIEINENLIVLGGCNYKLFKCNNQFWEFDTNQRTFTQFYNDKLFQLAETQGVLIGSNYYAFNNCKFEQECSENIYKIEFNFKAKKNICNKNGIWKNQQQCECFYGYYGNTCAYTNKCYFLNCPLNEFCQQNENCKQICANINCSDLSPNFINQNDFQQQAICLNNCTSKANGICQVNGLCLCNPQWTFFKKWRRLFNIKRQLLIYKTINNN